MALQAQRDAVQAELKYPEDTETVHYHKKRWFSAQYSHMRFVLEELHNSSNIYAFNRFKEEVTKNNFSVTSDFLILNVMLRMLYSHLHSKFDD